MLAKNGIHFIVFTLGNITLIIQKHGTRDIARFIYELHFLFVDDVIVQIVANETARRWWWYEASLFFHQLFVERSKFGIMTFEPAVVACDWHDIDHLLPAIRKVGGLPFDEIAKIQITYFQLRLDLGQIMMWNIARDDLALVWTFDLNELTVLSHPVG